MNLYFKTVDDMHDFRDSHVHQSYSTNNEKIELSLDFNPEIWNEYLKLKPVRKGQSFTHKDKQYNVKEFCGQFGISYPTFNQAKVKETTFVSIIVEDDSMVDWETSFL